MRLPSNVAITGILVAVFFTAIGVGRAQEVLPRPEPPFKGHIGPTVKDSTPDFPAEIKAPKGAPNILLIPGTSSVAHLRENLAAADLRLPDDAVAELDGASITCASKPSKQQDD